MAYLNRSNMLFQDYVWKASDEHDNPRLRWAPDNTLLSRKEGYEVLAFINHLAEEENWHPGYSHMGEQAERLIRAMPSEIRSREEAYKWVKTHWHSVFY